MKNIKTKAVAIAIIGMLTFNACSTLQKANNTQKGAGIGAVGGAVLGGIIGNQIGHGHSELGAVIGGVVGGVTGGIIGNKMDRQAERIENEVPGAKVERVNDGEAIAVTFDGQSGGVTFATAKYAVTSESKETLNKLIEVFKSYPDTNLLINGHTDSVGKDTDNIILSKKRTQSVRDYITSQGIDASRITTKWYGETKPKASNDSAEGRAINRRVEVFITANQKMIDEADQEAKNK